MRRGGTNFGLAPTYAMYPYLLFNAVSPSNHGATTKVAVRQAISYGINRSHLIVGLGGPALNPPLTHVLPDGINGAQYVPKGYDPYPYSPAKAKSVLAAAGYPSGLTVKLMYGAQDPISVKMYEVLAEDLAKVGVTVKGAAVPDAVFYRKFLADPAVARRGEWDLALAAGWGPDWYGDAAVSFFRPLLSGPPSFPPSCCNYGFYNNPALTSQISKAASEASAVTAGHMWGPDRSGGDEGRAHLPDRPADGAALSRQLRAQRDIRTSDRQFRPDQRLARHPHRLDRVLAWTRSSVMADHRSAQQVSAS
jgi:peptide/nickel transport system substrate-binding protein